MIINNIIVINKIIIIIYNFNIFLVFLLMVIKFCLAGARQLSAGVSFGGHLHILHLLGKERQN